jgi:hypothetical protein
MRHRKRMVSYSIFLFIIIILQSSCDIIYQVFPNRQPVADAGPDQSVMVGAYVTLDGSKSHDPDGQDISYAWYYFNAPSGTMAFLDNIKSANPSFNPDIEGDYVFLLVVSDGRDVSKPDSVTITANN